MALDGLLSAAFEALAAAGGPSPPHLTALLASVGELAARPVAVSVHVHEANVDIDPAAAIDGAAAATLTRLQVAVDRQLTLATDGWSSYSGSQP